MKIFKILIINSMFGYTADGVVEIEAGSAEAALAKAQHLDKFATCTLVCSS
jgi:hypothetical protein